MVMFGNAFELVNYFSQALWLSIAACVSGLIYLRFTRPEIPRPIKVNILIPIVFTIICLGLVLVPSISEPENLAINIAITLSGIPFYLICVKWQNKPAGYQRLSKKIERASQLVFNAIFIETEQQ